MSLVPKDLTPVYNETIGKGAGARRWQRPVYVDHLPPSNHACPAGKNIEAWLDGKPINVVNPEALTK